MRGKYANQELYTWSVGQRLPFDLAKRAERCFRFELGIQDGSTYINFGYWDSLENRLLSGENLQYDLRSAVLPHTGDVYLVIVLCMGHNIHYEHAYSFR